MYEIANVADNIIWKMMTGIRCRGNGRRKKNTRNHAGELQEDGRLGEPMSDTIRRKQQKKGGDTIAANPDNAGADVRIVVWGGATLPAAPSVRSAKSRHFSMNVIDATMVGEADVGIQSRRN